MNSQEYENNIMVLAKKLFMNHDVKKVNEKHWELRQPNTNAFWCDIIIIGGSIIVYGDIDICCFAYYSGRCPESAIEWMSKGVTSYEREKALIGMSHIGVDEYNSDVATHDLKQIIKDFDNEDQTIKAKYEKVINEAIESLKYGNSVEEMHKQFYDDFSEVDSDVWEWIYGIGRVISIRVINALAAIQRLNELIEGE